MRPGGGASKGAAFERIVCRDLSLWLTNGERADVFLRNVASGGRFTVRAKKDDPEHGMPGDVMAGHPTAFRFLEIFLVEAKCHADMGLVKFLYDTDGTSSLYKIVSKARNEAKHAGKLRPLIVMKENRHDPLLLTDSMTGEVALTACSRIGQPTYHRLHSDEFYLFSFPEFLSLCQPLRIIKELEQVKGV